MGSSTAASLLAQLDGTPRPGQVAAIVARSGVGKTPVAVRVALHHLLAGGRVLHVAFGDSVEHVRRHYAQVARGDTDRLALASAERNRMIHTYVGGGFDEGRFRASLAMWVDIAGFEPDLILFDGFTQGAFQEHLPMLADLARCTARRPVIVWCTVREAEGGFEAGSHPWALAPCVVRLVQNTEGLSVLLHREEGTNELGLTLHPGTFLAVAPAPELVSVEAVEPGRCTLFSGGANGAEVAFGELAQRYGLREVNFTFEGHPQARTQGSHTLSPGELNSGDVSLTYVSRRLNRDFTHGSLIRKVLQSLWHVVSKSDQVFVVGRILDDDTVVGGTGWSVELGRMWSKDVWVYDQDQRGWFRWCDDAWVAGAPTITAESVAGTGTRYLTEDGRRALELLFERSFGE